VQGDAESQVTEFLKQIDILIDHHPLFMFCGLVLVFFAIVALVDIVCALARR
jgi:hypothetical protein